MYIENLEVVRKKWDWFLARELSGSFTSEETPFSQASRQISLRERWQICRKRGVKFLYEKGDEFLVRGTIQFSQEGRHNSRERDDTILARKETQFSREDKRISRKEADKFLAEREGRGFINASLR